MRDPFLASTLVYAAATCLMGRRLLASAGSAVASDPGDPVFTAAILAWNATHVPWSDAWYQLPIFHPTGDALTLSEHLLGASLVASPIYWASGNPLLAYNLTILLSYPLCGMAMYALVSRLTSFPAAAFLAGLAFAFTPYRASQLPHIQMLVVWWAPLALLGLHGFLQAGPPAADPARRPSGPPGAASALPPWAGFRGAGIRAPRPRQLWLALFALCWALQGASNGYFLVYFSVVVGLWVLWFLIARGRFRDAGLVAAAAAIALLPLVPILYRYHAAHRDLGLSRSLGEIAAFGADIAAPLCAPGILTFWGWLQIACAQEGDLFPGPGVVVLCLVGALYRRTPPRPGSAEARAADGDVRSPDGADRRLPVVVRRIAVGIAAVYAGIALSVVAIGPWRVDLGWMRASASAADKPLSVALALLLVAGVASKRFREVVRRGATATFYLGAAIICWILSWGPFPRVFGDEALYYAPFAWLLQVPGVGGLRVPARFWMMVVMCLAVFMGLGIARLLRGRSRRATTAFVTLAAGLLLTDGWMTVPAAAVPSPPTTPPPRGTVVLELPAGDLLGDLGAVYRAVAGGWRAVNGFSGYEPGYYEALRTLAQARDPALFDPFVALNDLHVLIDADDQATRRLVEQQPGAELAASGAGFSRYRIPRRALVRETEAPAGERLAIASAAASCAPEGARLAIDGDSATSWVCGDQKVDHHLTITLPRIERAGRIVHALGTRAADFPRHLVVETSVDGTMWDAAWQGSPAAALLPAAMAAPRDARIALSFTPREARYVRLRQTGRHEVNFWSVAELEVWTGAH